MVYGQSIQVSLQRGSLLESLQGDSLLKSPPPSRPRPPPTDLMMNNDDDGDYDKHDGSLR